MKKYRDQRPQEKKLSAKEVDVGIEIYFEQQSDTEEEEHE